MDRYLDLRILADPEFPPHVLMNALFAKFHRVLVATKSQDIGVSFPETNEKIPFLGTLMRIHGEVSALERLMGQPWLTGMRDHLRIGEINAVPNGCPHRRVVRVQAKSNVERIRRRQMKRHGWTAEEARERIPSTIEQRLSLPFVSLDSQSSGHRFHLFLRHSESENIVLGSFNAYGLSSIATIPWF